MMSCAKSVSKLIFLDLSDCSIPDGHTDRPGMCDAVVSTFIRLCVGLEHINVSGVPQLTNAAFQSLKTICEELWHIDVGPGRLGHRGLVDCGGMLPMLEVCPRLRTLRMCSQDGNKLPGGTNCSQQGDGTALQAPDALAQLQKWFESRPHATLIAAACV